MNFSEYCKFQAIYTEVRTLFTVFYLDITNRIYLFLYPIVFRKNIFFFLIFWGGKILEKLKSKNDDSPVFLSSFPLTEKINKINAKTLLLPNNKNISKYTFFLALKF